MELEAAAELEGELEGAEVLLEELLQAVAASMMQGIETTTAICAPRR
ncbi:MAG: hypothetical protein ACRDP7_18295 [Trebonia sp.]